MSHIYDDYTPEQMEDLKERVRRKLNSECDNGSFIEWEHDEAEYMGFDPRFVDPNDGMSIEEYIDDVLSTPIDMFPSRKDYEDAINVIRQLDPERLKSHGDSFE